MKTLYLHAGFSKTGSSSLQLFLRENAARLSHEGIIYPEPPRLADRLIDNPAGNGVFLRAFLENPADKAGRAAVKGHLTRLAKGPHDRIILSNESLHQMSEDGFRALKAVLQDLSLKPVFVIVARDVIEHSLSAYRQRVGHEGLALGIEDYLMRARPRTGTTLDMLAGVFGPEALRVIPYQKDPAANIISTLAAMDTRNEVAAIDIPVVNTGLDALGTEVMRHLNTMGTSPGVCRAIAGALSGGVASPPVEGAPVKLALSDEALDWYREQARRINAHLDGPPLAEPDREVSIQTVLLSAGEQKLAQALLQIAEQAEDLRQNSSIVRLARLVRRQRRSMAGVRAFLASLTGAGKG
ncbi:hypothetical protein FF098_009565 [Parvularcula flava]|uniref:Uncharacterized protein n=1 Tax=Aquisalinus luteolus TaxID=1566827 RepID=A0A8J3A732_9PROT|nr:hypothetical protein [Aquisalinus luteolus]NHK28149.1 hypothetical protein [Aquisalinus luteolus]GGH97610.1 hypothetical protein GCM10011355_19250 [Aquisalinus luteolus]